MIRKLQKAGASVLVRPSGIHEPSTLDGFRDDNGQGKQSIGTNMESLSGSHVIKHGNTIQRMMDAEDEWANEDRVAGFISRRGTGRGDFMSPACWAAMFDILITALEIDEDARGET